MDRTEYEADFDDHEKILGRILKTLHTKSDPEVRPYLTEITRLLHVIYHWEYGPYRKEEHRGLHELEEAKA